MLISFWQKEKLVRKKRLKNKPQEIEKPIGLYFLVISAIIIIPLVYSKSTADPNLAPRLIAFALLIFGFSVLNFVKLIKKKIDFGFLKVKVFTVLLAYILWSLISITQAINPAEGSFDIIKTLLSLALLVFASQIFISNKNAFPFLVKAIIVSSLIATSFGLYLYFTEALGKSGNSLFGALYKIKGLMAHKNQFAISLLLMLPFTIYGILKLDKWWRGLSIYTSSLILLNIVIMQTRSVWVATIIFIFIFIFLWSLFFLKDMLRNNPGLLKKGVLVIIIFLVIGFGAILTFQESGAFIMIKNRLTSLFDTKTHHNQGRLKMWESTWEMSQDNMVFGVGAGNWRISIVPYYNVKHGSKYQNWRRPHNDYLWVLSEKGFIGLSLYLLGFLLVSFYAFKILMSNIDKNKKLITLLLISGIVAYLIISMFTFPMERINHQIYLMFMMAGIVSIYYESNEKVKNGNSKYYFNINVLILVISVLAIFYANTLIRSEVYVKKVLHAMNAKDQKLVIVNADKAFSIFTTIDFQAMPIHIYKGIANLRMGKYKQSREDLLTALDYFPTQIAVLSNLAIVSAELNDSKKAISYLEQSLDLYPHYEASLYNMINVYYLDKDYENAYLTLLECNNSKKASQYNDYMKVLKQLINQPNK